MILTLPLPPTDNTLKKPSILRGKPNLYPTQEYNLWKKQAEKAWLLFVLEVEKTLGQHWQIDVPSKYNQYEYSYRLYKADDRKDSQNFEKALRDFLSGRVYVDDRHVKLDLVMPVEIDKHNPRIEIDFCPENPKIYSIKKTIKIK